MKIELDEYGEEQIIVDNEDDLVTFLEAFEKLQVRAAKVATQLIAIEDGMNYRVDAEEITVEGGSLYANWETYCCGDSDYHQTHIPYKYLFDEDWLEQAQKEADRKKAAEEERKRIAAEKAAAAKIERERKQYLELKAKYEGDAS